MLNCIHKILHCTMYNLILVTIFKNEQHIITEWIDHYLNMGVDKIFMIDNGSTDDYRDKVAAYIERGQIEIVVDTTKWAQNKLYNKYYLKQCHCANWVLVADLDEFVYARKGYAKITEYLDSLGSDVVSVKIPWKMFGSNGHIEQPVSVIRSFTKRQLYDTQVTKSCKTITRGPHIEKLHLHECDYKNTANMKVINSSNAEEHSKKCLAGQSETLLQESHLHLNHYAIQSYNWCRDIKLTRGSAASKRTEMNIKCKKNFEKYFRDYDHNSITDEELSFVIS